MGPLDYAYYMKKTWLLLIFAALALGCGEGRYQIVTLSEGPVAYRLDTKTGEMLLVVRDKAAPVRQVRIEDLYN